MSSATPLTARLFLQAIAGMPEELATRGAAGLDMWVKSRSRHGVGETAPLDATARAKQAAEKGLGGANWRSKLLQGLKPNVDSIGFIGPAEAVPLLQSI